MKSIKRLFSLLLCFAVLSSVYSLEANAQDIDYQIYSVLNYDSTNIISGMVYPYDDTRQTLTNNKSLTGVDGAKCYYEIYLAKKDKTALIDKESTFSGKLENIYIVGSTVLPNIATYSLEFTSAYSHLLYTDGTTETMQTDLIEDRNGYYCVSFNAEAKKDVSQIYIQLSSASNSFTNGKNITLNATLGEPSTNVESNNNIVFNSLSIDVESEELGFLDSIVKKLGELWESISSLPSKIWNYISDGLKGLFIPSEEYLNQAMEDWKLFLSDKFGALYQVGDLLIQMGEDIQEYDKQDSIEMPSVTISFGDTDFTFGGYVVKIIPEGFEFAVDVLKSIVGVLSTFAFIMGLRKRYDEVMGVEQ